MPYLILRTVTAQNANSDSFTYAPGTVVSDWEINDFIKGKIGEGAVWYRMHFEPLTEEDALHHRTKATAAEGDRFKDGVNLKAPWPDYVGLHPEEVISRLQSSASPDEVASVKQFERAGMNRSMIVEYTAPVEREPFGGYDDMAVREILAKFAILDDRSVQEAINYETAHRKRPAIIQYEKEEFLGAAEAAKTDELATA